MPSAFCFLLPLHRTFAHSSGPDSCPPGFFLDPSFLSGLPYNALAVLASSRPFVVDFLNSIFCTLPCFRLCAPSCLPPTFLLVTFSPFLLHSARRYQLILFRLVFNRSEFLERVRLGFYSFLVDQFIDSVSPFLPTLFPYWILFVTCADFRALVYTLTEPPLLLWAPSPKPASTPLTVC